VQGRNATLHVLETTIRNQSSAGVEVSGTKANAWVFENRFEDNSRHVVFADSATGNLGEVGLGTTLNGKNRFRHSTLWAVDAYGYAAGKTLKAELNDWGTASRSAIEGRIRFRIGDARHVSVDFDPLIGNVHPKALTLAAAGGPPPAVTGLSVFAAQGGATIVFALSAPGTATVEVLSPAGRRLHTLWSARPCSSGTNTLGWNGLGDNGLRVPSGTYLVRVIVRGADGRQAQATAPLRCRR
jgi:hypothetical protein